jgi:hypothetical protein
MGSELRNELRDVACKSFLENFVESGHANINEFSLLAIKSALLRQTGLRAGGTALRIREAHDTARGTEATAFAGIRVAYFLLLSLHYRSLSRL